MLPKPLGTAIYIDNLQLSFQENPGILKNLESRKILDSKLSLDGDPLFGRWILEADSFWGAVVDEWDNARYVVSIIIHLSTLQARWKLWHISKIFLEICHERTPIWKQSQINAQENMKISMIFLEFYPERTTFRIESKSVTNKNSFEESFFILTSAILKVPSFIKDSFECHSDQFIDRSINEQNKYTNVFKSGGNI